MTITVAGKKKEYPQGLTVSELIKAEDVENPLYVTVTINDDFVKSDELETKVINDGDEIEFLYFMGGGC
jgi:sulfur carrier protein